ncbi:spermine transporter [Coprinopsis cinerea okayama7|uniref:Spermine transporter n=1 Tax=Coprinopsis cinerea (strain Okayama-7 / 130 / ATCC MYA-4618 / FGSC 9003) TaxID=240176 RepID=A8NLH1_COPC7|nr:spermine transporter [Coprinopsis cinerea okayama7\|eukprot:XP_001834685.1 spermine transporter [Coprinopsis cinerea okayama7\
MPSEPIEAALFTVPPALSHEQEERLRTLDREGPLVLTTTSSNDLSTTPTAHHPLERVSTRGTQNFSHPDEKKDVQVTVNQLSDIHEREGFKIVKFEPGTGEDPREWSKGKKWFVTVSSSLLCLAVALGSSIITGDMGGPTREFGNTQVITNLTVTCFVIGFGVGPLFLAPLSEIFGRTPIYSLSMFLFFIFTLPSALAKNIATLVVSRQIAGLAASAPVCNVGGSIADVWDVKDRGAPMALFSGTLFIGPCLGPMIGGWIGERAGWRWIYWVLFALVGASWLLTLFMPESLAPVILRRKAERLRKETGDDTYQTLEELERLPFKEVLKIALIRPFIMLFTEPIVIFMSIYLSFVYSLLYLMFFAFPIAFTEIRGWGEGITGVAFVSIMIGIFLAGLFIPLNEKTYREATKYGSFPEARLYPMMWGAFLMPAALFMFAFTGAYEHVHWIGVCISGTCFGFAMILLYVSANSYIVDSYSNFAATAMAAKTFLRSEIGAMIPLFSTPMFHNMGFQYAGLLLALVAVAISPMPFVFYFYGEKIRARSKRATQDVRKREPSSFVSEK